MGFVVALSLTILWIYGYARDRHNRKIGELNEKAEKYSNERLHFHEFKQGLKNHHIGKY